MQIFNLVKMSGTECLFRFLVASVRDTGTGNTSSTVGRLLEAINAYNNNAPTPNQLSSSFTQFSTCVEPNLVQAGRDLAETIVFALVLVVILAVLFVVIFLGALFWYQNLSLAVGSIVALLLFFFFLYYYVTSRAMTILDIFNRASEPCLVTLANQLQAYENAQFQAITTALCPN